MDHMAPTDVTEWPDFADLYKNGAVRVLAKGHPRLKQNIGARLASEFFLVRWVTGLPKPTAKARLVIRSHEDHDGSGFSECCLKYFPNVGRPLADEFEGLAPLQGLQPDRSQE